jgi:hypothetical protein
MRNLRLLELNYSTEDSVIEREQLKILYQQLFTERAQEIISKQDKFIELAYIKSVEYFNNSNNSSLKLSKLYTAIPSIETLDLLHKLSQQENYSKYQELYSNKIISLFDSINLFDSNLNYDFNFDYFVSNKDIKLSDFTTLNIKYLTTHDLLRFISILSPEHFSSIKTFDDYFNLILSNEFIKF